MTEINLNVLAQDIISNPNAESCPYPGVNETKETNEEKIIKICEQENLFLIFPDAYELQLDIDNEHSYNTFLTNFDNFKKISPDAHVKYFVKSKSNKPFHFHIVIGTSTNYDANESTQLSRRLHQVTLGSDPAREILNLVQGNPPFLFCKARSLEEVPSIRNCPLLNAIYKELCMDYFLDERMPSIQILHIYYLREAAKLDLISPENLYNPFLEEMAISLTRKDSYLLKQYMDFRQLKYGKDPEIYDEIKSVLQEVWDNGQS